MGSAGGNPAGVGSDGPFARQGVGTCAAECGPTHAPGGRGAGGCYPGDIVPTPDPATKTAPAEVASRADDAALDHSAADVATADELPIVARLAIEIRSDGTRTIARGAMHDIASGQQVAIEIGDGTALQLARQLTTQVSSAVVGVLARAFGRAIPSRLPALLRRRKQSRS